MKRKDSAVSSEGEIPVKNVSKAKQEKMKRRTLGVSGELHLELKALSVWRIKSHPKASPGITDTIQEMMRVYYKKYPEAKEFVEKFCATITPIKAIRLSTNCSFPTKMQIYLR